MGAGEFAFGEDVLSVLVPAQVLVLTPEGAWVLPIQVGADQPLQSGTHEQQQDSE